MSRTVSMQFGKPGGAVQNAGGSSGITFDTLWTNPSPTSSFAAQDVDVDLSNYTWFAVKYKYQTSYPHDCPLAVFSVDEENKILMVSNISTNRTGGRVLYYTISTKKIHFNAAGYNGSATSNITCVPIEIYGIKF